MTNTSIDKELVFDTVKQLDKDVDASHEAFKPACVLLASMFMPADEEEIAIALDFSRADVIAYGAKLRANGIWRGKELYAEWLNIKRPTAELAFWMDVRVALGIFERLHKDGQYHYKITPQGRQEAIAIGQRLAKRNG